MSYTVYIQPNQNIIDVCLQELGSLDELQLLHKVNGFNEVPYPCNPGDLIIIPDIEKKKQVTNILQRKNPATGPEAEIQQTVLGGIGNMAVGVDFKVS